MSDTTGYAIAVPAGLDPGGAKTAAVAAQLSAQSIPVRQAAPGNLEVGAVTVNGVGAAASQLFAAFGCGVELDIAADPPVLRPREDLARGSIEVHWPDGHTEARSGLQPAQVGYVLRTALATTGR